MDKNECADFAGIPGGLGHDGKEEVCQSCVDAEECETITQKNISVVKEKPKKTKKESTGEHKFLKGSVRWQVSEWLTEKIEIPEISSRLVRDLGMTEKNSYRKINAVKKLIGK